MQVGTLAQKADLVDQDLWDYRLLEFMILVLMRYVVQLTLLFKYSSVHRAT